jgi:hypothetical protein
VAGVQCATSAFGDEQHRMLRIIQCFSKHCSCHIQVKCIVVRCFWKPCIGQAVDGKLDLMVHLYKASKNAQTLHIHPKDGNCNVCRNIG